MSTFTKEQLLERAREKVKGLEYALKHPVAFADTLTELEEELELARIALASLEAEPVYQAFSFERWRDVSEEVFEAEKKDGCQVRVLYTTPPAPVSESEPMKMFGIGSVFKPKILSGDEVDCDSCAHYQPNVCHGEGCPAAMLQGAEPVSNRDELPDGWVACSERMPEVRKPVYIFHPDYGVDQCVWYDHQEGAFVWGDETRLRELESVSHWMAMPKLPSAPRKEV
ncbi:DUF551 domain-containing protein [Enterobacter hormaechei]|uniref:DUF551 domain-containing protein n=2 Tax=Enterobacter cloacae complex TaxID=354276 RepID=UPI0006961611|nr:DUF551 domain-containing protein [Enterobacter hormaechei]MCF0045077.1 DUF551 domain-containing protein [Enterobacter hormaechei]PRW21954.1 hypothetical protein CSC03_1016 [Enterobacter hormaechei]GJL05262.1 phage protein [Enterobacter cloacae]